MKELIALLLAAVMCLSLAACGKEIKVSDDIYADRNICFGICIGGQRIAFEGFIDG